MPSEEVEAGSALPPDEPAPVLGLEEPVAAQTPEAEPEELEEPPPEPIAMHPGGPDLEIARRVPTGAQPKSVTVSPDGSRLYVCNFGFANRRNVFVYETEGLQQVGRIDFPGNAVEVAVSDDGQTLYISNFGRGLIEIVDAITFEVRGEVEVDNNPKWMVIDQAREPDS